MASFSRRNTRRRDGQTIVVLKRLHHDLLDDEIRHDVSHRVDIMSRLDHPAWCA